jgi:putative salt-induced outer membrane protein
LIVLRKGGVVRTQYLGLALLVLINGNLANGSAQIPNTKAPLANETEASVSMSSGNTNSESYAGEHSTEYKLQNNHFKFAGRYQATVDSGREIAKSWSLSGRYERVLSAILSGYYGHKLESDLFAGYVQKNNHDLGGKYFFKKTTTAEVFSELGYRNTFGLMVDKSKNKTTNFVRGYFECKVKSAQSSQLRFWIEYLSNVKESRDYEVNFEPSYKTAVNSLLSLKVSYLGKYSNIPSEGAARYDSLFVTSLIAKY